MLAREAEGILQNLLKKGRLQITPRAGNNPMAALGKKARHNLSIFLPDRVLGFVAVALLQRRGGDGQHLWLQPSDAPQVVLYKLGLVAQLGVVADVPEGAATAFFIDWAAVLHSVRGGLQQFIDDAEGKVFLHLDDAHLQLVPHRGVGDKHHHPIDLGDAVAVRGHRGDGGLLDLIFM